MDPRAIPSLAGLPFGMPAPTTTHSVSGADSSLPDTLRTIGGFCRTDAPTRRVLVLKGLVYGLPEEIIQTATTEAIKIIEEKRITTIAWDGDKLLVPGDDKKHSFTSVIPSLIEQFPHLELLFFKKIGGKDDPFSKARALFSGQPSEEDDHKNTLGPYQTLTEENTELMLGDERPEATHKKKQNRAVVFGAEKWYTLGLKGLQFIKQSLRVDRVYIVIVGSGGRAVEKERENIDSEFHPSGYKKAVEVPYDRRAAKEDAPVSA